MHEPADEHLTARPSGPDGLCWCAHKQADRQAGRKAGRKADRQADVPVEQEDLSAPQPGPENLGPW